jgi:methionine synthase II (cobalamin-independent)
MLGLRGLATGIGSLPHREVGEALELVFKYFPQIPFWPQLPKRDIREGMVAQFSEGLPCVEVNSRGAFFNPQDKEKKLEEFYARVITPESDHKKDPFKISPEYAAGLYAFHKRLKASDLSAIRYIKCHITGPFTFAASLKDEKGVALLHDAVFMQAIIEGLARKALWQIGFFREFAKKLIIFIDEPYLGCFGSAYTPINREEVVKGLGSLTENIKLQPGTLTGVHCCGNTDWSIFIDTHTLDIINFDAFSYLDKLLLYADDLKGFFGNNRIFCWGIVPTQEFSDRITAEGLVKKINDGIATLVGKGVDKDKLSENLLLSPACGLGTLDTEKAEGIFGILAQLSSLVRQNGARLG